MTRTSPVEEYPSLLWIVIPPVLILSGYFARKWYLRRRLALYGLGKGAPGFQTSVRRIRVTPEIAARIRRGEEVSPEEITAAAAKAEEDERRGTSSSEPPLENRTQATYDESSSSEPINEWLPPSITAPKKRTKGKRK